MLTRTLFRNPLRLHARFFTAAPQFPCVDQNESRSQRLSYPEPAYSYSSSIKPSIFSSKDPLKLDYGSSLPYFDIAYETWGKLNADRSNAILLHTGLSASSHAHSTPSSPSPGWWESFIGPGKPIDTDNYYVICTNVLGGCHGSTGPSSPSPHDSKPYATRFPLVSIFDMVRAQFRLLDHLGIDSLYASVGSSMGAMQSIAAVHLFPDRVRNLVAISGTARTSPASIALRYAQRSVLMSDPNWNRGFYYDGIPPHTGMKLARQIATITYRSGPEWEQRFGRRRKITPSNESQSPQLCPDFLIETYLDHQGEQFCLKYDANSLIYISKAMDLFDMTASGLEELTSPNPSPENDHPPKKPHISTLASPSHLPDLALGLSNLSRHPTLIIGVQSDILFPVNEQRELAEALRMLGNDKLSYYELNSPYGHDSFLVDVSNVGGALRGFLSKV